MTTLTPAAAPLRPVTKPQSRLGGRWTRFALRRTGRLLVSLWVLVTLAFLMIHLVPGDPVRAALGMNAPTELVEAKRQALGLDDPLLTQYVHYLGNLLHGDLGESIVSQLPVTETISQRLPATASLAVLAFLVAIAAAIPLGVGVAVAGRDGASSYVLPVLALAIGPAAVLARIVRVEMLSVLEADYIRTARAKRLPALRINLRHALPNAVTATLTIGGMLLASMVAGTVLVENVFAWPGLGSTIVQSIVTKDYPVVQGTVLVYGLGVLLINTVVDVALAVLDPRSTIGDL